MMSDRPNIGNLELVTMKPLSAVPEGISINDGEEVVERRRLEFDAGATGSPKISEVIREQVNLIYYATGGTRPSAVLLGHHSFCRLQMEKVSGGNVFAGQNELFGLNIFLDDADPYRCTVLRPPMETITAKDYSAPAPSPGFRFLRTTQPARNGDLVKVNGDGTCTPVEIMARRR